MAVATPSKWIMHPHALLYEMITICLLHPLTTSTVSHRFIPSGTLGTGFCVPAPVEGDDATGFSVEVLVEEFVTASLLSVVRASDTEVLERRSEEAGVWFARGTALPGDIVLIERRVNRLEGVDWSEKVRSGLLGKLRQDRERWPKKYMQHWKCTVPEQATALVPAAMFSQHNASVSNGPGGKDPWETELPGDILTLSKKHGGTCGSLRAKPSSIDHSTAWT
ncbi:MAG: hypothetical protein Q9172_001475 [Xanthocarpia lactea]